MSLRLPGKYITLEGIDGSGTTTQAQRLACELFTYSKNHVVVLTREPTKQSPSGQELRRRLIGNLNPGEVVIDDPKYWANLFVEDRKWNLDNIVKPNLENGLLVVSDRHFLSTIAYQSVQGLSVDELMQMHQGFYRPDLTIYLDFEVSQAQKRLEIDRAKPEYFDGKLVQLVDAYRNVVSLLKDDHLIVTVNGNQPIVEVTRDIFKHVKNLL